LEAIFQPFQFQTSCLTRELVGKLRNLVDNGYCDCTAFPHVIVM